MSLLFAATVLIIGDSHSVGPFGWYLDKNLRNEGLNVATYASCGSIPNWWVTGKRTPCGFYSNDLRGQVTQTQKFPTPILANLLHEMRPDVVLVELGANFVNIPDDKYAINDLKAMVKNIKNSGSRCYWIGPPDSRKYRTERPRIYRLVNEAVGSDCPIFDSLSVTSYPDVGGDGVHYWFKEGMPIAKKWADAVAADFLNVEQTSNEDEVL